MHMWRLTRSAHAACQSLAEQAQHMVLLSNNWYQVTHWPLRSRVEVCNTADALQQVFAALHRVTVAEAFPSSAMQENNARHPDCFIL